MARPDVAAGDKETLAAGQKSLLKLHGSLCRPLAAGEVSDERRAVGQLQCVPPAFGVLLQRATQPVGRLTEAGAPDEKGTPQGATRAGILRVDLDRAANRGDAFGFLPH